MNYTCEENKVRASRNYWKMIYATTKIITQQC